MLTDYRGCQVEVMKGMCKCVLRSARTRDKEGIEVNRWRGLGNIRR